ncbi:SDR family NAD(P)-dependent oxidoreductase [Pseudobythopirellula maris]|uniref:SDR family NAD(P)-dependent oxidoreductase n=1 Tax=Pseudobythopirellula maris TaxID=2527991 RepID=UPI0018D2A243|nr:SDR family NAD(P)-dependent oxidoreductase [Pseudobythopirellula maris]
MTGGSAGLGLAIADALASRGAAVRIAGRDAGKLDEAAAWLRRHGGMVETTAVDLAEQGAGGRLSAEAAPLDLLCHAAGRSMRGRVVDTTAEEFEALWRINFLAAAELARGSAAGLAERRGSLVLIGSLATHSAPRNLGAYPTSKFPLAALAQQLRLEMGEGAAPGGGLHTLLVCPGPIARPDGGARYDDQASGLDAAARKPGAGAKVSAIDPDRLAEKILNACERRQSELVLPKKARLLFALSRLSPDWGDWLLRKMSG